MTAKSNAREGDGVWDAFRALDAAIAYEGDCTARKALRKARETFAAMQAQQGAEPVAWQPALEGMVRLSVIQGALDAVVPPKMTESRAEYWKAGARAAVDAINAAIKGEPK